MLQYFDIVDIAAAIAPKPLLLTYGRYDNPVYRQEYETGEAQQRLLPAWNVTGNRHGLELNLHEGSHEYNVDATLAFFDRHLKGIR